EERIERGRLVVVGRGNDRATRAGRPVAHPESAEFGILVARRVRLERRRGVVLAEEAPGQRAGEQFRCGMETRVPVRPEWLVGGTVPAGHVGAFAAAHLDPQRCGVWEEGGVVAIGRLPVTRDTLLAAASQR